MFILLLTIIKQKCIFVSTSIINRFLVSDNPELKKELSQKYRYIITYNSTIGHSEHVAQYGYTKIAADCLVEIYLLSKCDIIIKTQYSTFGDVSKIIGNHV